MSWKDFLQSQFDKVLVLLGFIAVVVSAVIALTHGATEPHITWFERLVDQFTVGFFALVTGTASGYALAKVQGKKDDQKDS